MLAWLSLSASANAQPLPSLDTGIVASADATTPAPQASPVLPLRLRLSDDVIRQAVRETTAEMAEKETSPSGAVLSGDRYQAFARDVDEARKPGCFGPDALKFQPSGFSTKNWNVGLGGVFALPFWAAAIARGKCN